MARAGRRRAAQWRARATLTGALLAAAAAPGASVEIVLPGCAPPAELAAALTEPQQVGARCGADADCWQTALAAARRTRDRFPDQYDAHRAYLLTARAAVRALGTGHLAPLATEYERLAGEHASNPAYRHLFAQLALEGDDYRRELERLAADHPRYPWAYLSLAFQMRPGAGEEQRERARQSLARFLAICPERSAEGARALELVGDRALVNEAGGRLRAAALARGDADALALLWPLALSAAGGESREAVRAEVAGELAAFAAAAGTESVGGLRALQRGYDAVGDREARARVEDILLAREPCGDEASRIRSLRFRERHPPPAEPDAGAQEAWLEAGLAELDRALAVCPGDESAHWMRVQLLARAPAARDAELLAAVDRLLALPLRRLEIPPSVPGWTARLYVERGLRLDRVPALLDRDFEDASADFRRRSAAGDPEAAARYGWRRRENLRIRLAHGLVAGDVAAARHALDDLERETAAAPGGGVAPAFRGATRFPDERTELDLLAARVLTAEGRGEEALRRLARLVPDPVLGPAIEAGARAAWRAARGSAEGFDAWASALAAGVAAEPWRVVDRPLPAAALTEFGGGPWSWGEQRGRTVVLYVWSTWCTPCRERLPWLERLAERFALRPDVVVATANADRTNASLLPFLGERDLALPVLTGADGFSEEELRGVPAIWIVAPDGRVRRELAGFAGGAEEWLAAAAAEVEAVAGPAPSPAGG